MPAGLSELPSVGRRWPGLVSLPLGPAGLQASFLARSGGCQGHSRPPPGDCHPWLAPNYEFERKSTEYCPWGAGEFALLSENKFLTRQCLTNPSCVGETAARAEVERWFTAPGVRRIRLKEGGVRGSLFLPPGDGPFPGVIDMYGDEGGLIEFRSSLLATRGFAALSLPYFDFEDLPKVMKEFNLEYFEEAARFLQRHPKVSGPGVGVIGTGKGAELALSMITFLPEVVAAVCISGCSSNTVADLHYGEMTLPGLRFDMNKVSVSDAGVFDIFEALDDPMNPANSPCTIPIEKAEGHFLLVVGEDDRMWKSSLYAELVIGRLRQHGKENFKLLSYPGAGHRIDPPSTPFCQVAMDRVLGVPVLGGGESKAHAHAQEHSWRKIQEFLHLHLG
uniref:BAAT/Acyl-CoA thioester hydrolase C-terminal domain-containing protein n=1 Tax=Bubo bubo TaxID=30461 RepID=A0A8C0ECG8_BUBBB